MAEQAFASDNRDTVRIKSANLPQGEMASGRSISKDKRGSYLEKPNCPP